MGMDTPTPWGTVQGSRVLKIGRRLYIGVVLDGVLVLAPSTLYKIVESKATL